MHSTNCGTDALPSSGSAKESKWCALEVTSVQKLQHLPIRILEPNKERLRIYEKRLEALLI